MLMSAPYMWPSRHWLRESEENNAGSPVQVAMLTRLQPPPVSKSSACLLCAQQFSRTIPGNEAATGKPWEKVLPDINQPSVLKTIVTHKMR